MKTFPGAWWNAGRVLSILEVFNSLVRYRKTHLFDSYPKPVTECFKLLSVPAPNYTVQKQCIPLVERNFPDDVEEVLEECRRQPGNERHVSGRCNDLTNHWTGSRHTRFGRNIPRDMNPELHRPEPSRVAQLFDRKGFVPAEIINLLAVGWIQFMTHDWFHHDNNRAKSISVPDGCCSCNCYQIFRTQCALNDCCESENEVTHWWDSSQLYGATPTAVRSLRLYRRGHLRLHKGDLPKGRGGLPRVGFNENWWVGLHLMHLIFSKEHNAIADHLARQHPSWNDEKLFQQTRIIISALIAKLHVLEWTKAILRNRIAHLGLDYNWKGTNITKIFGAHNVPQVLVMTNNTFPRKLPGAVGEKTVDHGVPFSLTNEFVAVYRMHSLLPDEVSVRSPETGLEIVKRNLYDLSLKRAARTVKKDGVQNLLFSFGKASAGALVLHNYPNLLRNIKIKTTSRKAFDLAVVDILRDRERRIPRYNAVRRSLGLTEARTFEELCGGNKSLAEEMAGVYDSIDDVDFMVGTHAEQPRPSGFGFSDTVFRIFSFMARRRLETDRFFTTDYREAVYTREGLAWIKQTTMKDILLRHWPELGGSMKHVTNAFAPWDKREWQTPLNFTEPWN